MGLQRDCDDDDAQRFPGAVEACDGRDNDCDTDLDEGAINACGGECVTPFEHQPDERCDNAQLGVCARDGAYVCDGDARLLCTAVPVEPSSEVCGNQLDDDCDGETDEGDAVDAKTWYKDCDGDTFAASTAGAVKACTKPASVSGCTWTVTLPQAAAKINWDCDDRKREYRPGADYNTPPLGSTSWDLNCDGVTTAAPSLHAGLHPCSADVVARLNEEPGYCTSAMHGCFLWKGSDGRYRNTPTTKCPDTNAYRVTATGVHYPPPNGPLLWICSIDQRGAVWPCR